MTINYILQAYICQGDAFLAMDQLDLAEKSYSIALEIDPSIRRSKSFKVYSLLQFKKKQIITIDFMSELCKPSIRFCRTWFWDSLFKMMVKKISI